MNEQFNDLYGRILKVGDYCLRITVNKFPSKPTVTIVQIEELRNVTVKIGERCYVAPYKLIKFTPDGMSMKDWKGIKKCP
jgi:hypothetical protein